MNHLRGFVSEDDLVSSRWDGAPSCPSCGADGRALSDPTTTGWRQWRCCACRRKFTVATGTRMHSTKLSPDAWCGAATLVCVSPDAVMEALPVSRASAYRVASVLSPAAGYDLSARVRYLLAGREEPTAPVDPWLKSPLPTHLKVEDNPLPQFSEGSKATINALRNRVFGATAAKVAELSGVSCSHTFKVLSDLERRDIAVKERRGLGHGDGLHVKTVWRLSNSPACRTLSSYLRFRRVTAAPTAPDKVPARFWWLFWSGSHGSRLRISEHGLHIASTLLTSRDVCARFWALRNMPDSILAECRDMRGLDTADMSKMITAELNRRDSSTSAP